MTGNCPKEKRIKVPVTEILDKIEHSKPFECNCVIVEGDLDLGNLDLSTEHIERTEKEKEYWGLSENVKVVTSKIIITDSQINGKVNFSNTIFKGRVDFSNTIFSAHANFNGTHFIGYASFDGVHFDGEDPVGISADFTGAQFISAAANFEQAHFRGGALFIDTQFNGKDVAGTSADFMGAKFSRKDPLVPKDLPLPKDLYDLIESPVRFLGAKFNGGALFRNAQFDGDANFIDAQFSGGSDFRGAKFGGLINLTNFRFDIFRVSWQTLKDHLYYDGATYLSLVKSFKDLEQFEDADACYYQYRKERRKWLKGLPKILDWISLIAYGYGVHPEFPLIGLVVMFLLSAGVYLYGNQVHSLPKALDLSIVILTTTTQIGNLTEFCRFWSILERILGWLLMASFLVALAKKTIR